MNLPPAEGSCAADGNVPSAVKVAQSLLRDGRREIVRADEKASTLLTAVGIVVGMILTVVAGFDQWPFHLGQATRAMGWLAIVAATFGICCLISVILPRHYGRKDGTEITYFADVVRVDRDGELDAAIRAASQDILRHTLDQLRLASRIAFIKYQLIRIAIVSLASAAVLGATTWVLHAVEV